MKKEIKKIESRQDVLSHWVEKGATWQGKDIKEAKKALLGGFYLLYKTRRGFVNKSLHEILYSIDSNFFVSVFGKTRDGYHKKNCVDSLDPLQYLLDNLNETTS